ncbi:hypothetical protein PC123_g26160 [Phytophthora cactorum]|nr:hypothetical protein PC123_g26160 [Phytophthora cactorum]
MQLRSVIFLAAVIVQVSSGNKSTSKTSKFNGWYSCSEYTFSGTGSSDAQTAECATYSAPLCYPGVCKAPEKDPVLPPTIDVDVALILDY